MDRNTMKIISIQQSTYELLKSWNILPIDESLVVFVDGIVTFPLSITTVERLRKISPDLDVAILKTIGKLN